MIAFKNLKLEIKLKAKNGVDFIIASSVIWFIIFGVWVYFDELSAYDKSLFSIIIAIALLPLTYLFSKIFKTNWTIKNNPLQPLRSWLNFSHLIYFPFLLLVLIKFPDYFIVAYAILFGAHLFPLSWFYGDFGYAFSAITISVGALLIAVYADPNKILYVPLLTTTVLLVLGVSIFIANRKLYKKFKKR